MFTIFLYSLKRFLGQILGWGISLALLGVFMAGFYDTLAKQQEDLMELIAQYPKELMVFFGAEESMGRKRRPEMG